METPSATEAAPRGRRIDRTPPVLTAIPPVSMEQMFAVLSLALDLAEGRPKGHALRVCFISASLAREVGLAQAQRSAAFLAGLLHDIGVARAGEQVGNLPRMYEHEIFAASPLHGPDVIASRVGGGHGGSITEAFHEHAFEGAAAVAALGLPPQVAEAVLCHHERHDGGGFPLGLAGADVPVLARILAVADYSEALLTAEPNPLMARRRLEIALREQSGRRFHPTIVDAMVTISRTDSFWLGFHNHGMIDMLADLTGHEPRLIDEMETLRIAAAFADIIDSKSSFKRGHSRRVAMYARGLATASGRPEGHVRALELAALLHDIGMLRVPSRIIGKPEILTVQEMKLMHEYPLESADIIRTVPGWGALADWTSGHHERLDGRGYPDGLTAERIPFEARVLTIADIYEALTAQRPHRPALLPADAIEVMRGMAGTVVDVALFARFEETRPSIPLGISGRSY